MHVALDFAPAVTQAWDEAKGVIEVTNSFMIPFPKLFGVEVDNSIFTFATNIDTPTDLVTHVRQLFRPAKRDTRGATNLSSAVDNGVDDASVEENEDSDLDDDDDTDSSGDAGGVTVVTNHAAEIQQLDEDNEEDGDDNSFTFCISSIFRGHSIFFLAS